MKSLIVPAAAALVLSIGTASAQTYESHTTTTQTSPESGTQTTTSTTERDDGYATFRKTVTATHHYDDGTFAAPAGYTYTRYNVGDHVPGVLLSSDGLMLTDYANYQLVAPPRGLEWIRVGNDALLVNRANGEVIQTDYGLFE
ncbi:MAG TPA: RcnB family protein [Rhizomicrobium sp.]|nr:RcnB family protein [Rhizomicrobium sp.]